MFGGGERWKARRKNSVGLDKTPLLQTQARRWEFSAPGSQERMGIGGKLESGRRKNLTVEAEHWSTSSRPGGGGEEKDVKTPSAKENPGGEERVVFQTEKHHAGICS